MRAVLPLGLLVAVYSLTIASVAPWDLALGALAAAGALVVVHRLPTLGSAPGRAPALRRALHFPLFVLAVAREVTVGTWHVSLAVVGLSSPDPGFVEVPVGRRSPTGIAVTALSVTLSPGDVFVDLDEERGVMLVHMLDAGAPEEVRRRYEEFYERYQRPVFP